jgi:hypothetical protein
MMDVLNHSGPLEMMTRGLVTKVMHGDMAALLDLSYASRRAQYPLLDATRVPTLCFSSTGGAMSLMAPLEAYMHKKYKLESDGAVSPLDARVTIVLFCVLCFV